MQFKIYHKKKTNKRITKSKIIKIVHNKVPINMITIRRVTYYVLNFAVTHIHSSKFRRIAKLKRKKYIQKTTSTRRSARNNKTSKRQNGKCFVFFLKQALSPKKFVELDLKHKNTHTANKIKLHTSRHNLFVVFLLIPEKIKFVTDKNRRKPHFKKNLKLKMIFVCACCHCWMSTALEFICSSSKKYAKKCGTREIA